MFEDGMQPSGNFCYLKSVLCLFVSLAMLLTFAACDAEIRKTDAQLGLSPQQSTGRKIYDNYCDRCHEPYSRRDKKGPSLKNVFQKQFLPVSGMPANDDRVSDIVVYGRAKMPGFGQTLTQQQVQDLLAYLHTL
jgi:mono/diheme cytochrome c family protein